MKTRPIILLLALCVCGCDSLKKVKELAKATEAAEENVTEGLAAVAAAEGGAVHKLTADDFENFTGQSGKLVVVDFYADWCGPCKRLAPMLDKLAAEFGDQVAVGKLDVDAYGAVAKKHGVRGIPDVRFFRDGKEVDKIVGLPPEKDLRSRMEQHMGKPEEAPTAVEEKKPEFIVENAIQKAKEKEPVAATPVTKKEPDKDKETKQPVNAEDAKEPEKPKEPAMQPMKKDWMPPGIERR